MTTVDERRLAIIARFSADPWLAHSYLFAHRHQEESSTAHRELVKDIWDQCARRNIEAFRGFGKSTYLEETLVLRAALRMHHHMLILAASERRAIERLGAVKHELETNEKLIETFGPLVGEPWQETNVVLSNGIRIQALGRDQKIVGLKHLEWRPDCLLVDDLEDPDEQYRSEDDRRLTWAWFVRTVVASLDSPTGSWIRVLGTRRGSGGLPERLEAAGWPTSKFPVETVGRDGERVAAWPAKFALEKIDEIKGLYAGDMHGYEQEYMCRADSEVSRVFNRGQFRVEPQTRSWHPVSVFYDPARTKTQTSATTGKAVWSWVGHRLVVWEAGGHFWSPEELIDDIVTSARRYDPTWIGVEKTGLNDWLMQPLRHRMMREGIILPLIGVEAPRGKLDFIRALQPMAAAGEIVLAGEPDAFRTLLDQFDSFPRGRIDAPNALAYAPRLRPGQPVYDGFGSRHIAVDTRALHDAPLYVAANADGQVVTACLVQRQRGALVVLADYVAEGLPGEVLGGLASEISLGHSATTLGERVHWGRGGDLYKLPTYEPRLAPTEPKWIVPPSHYNEWNNHGLVQAIRGIPAACSMGAIPEAGRSAVARLLDATSLGEPLFRVAETARWSLRGLSGGYARAVGGRGLAEARAQDGIYRTLIEGLESFAGAGEKPDTASPAFTSPQPVAYTKGGMAYKSAIPGADSRGHRR